MKFLSGLEFTLTEGLSQEKLATLRQCVERIYINKPGNEIKMLVCEVPVGNLQRTEYLEIEIYAFKLYTARSFLPTISLMSNCRPRRILRLLFPATGSARQEMQLDMLEDMLF